MRKHIKHFSLLIFLLITLNSFAQEKEGDTINTGVIDVIKPYTPSISDAFKVKEAPTINDTTTNAKKTIKYNIFSFPVASTFTPAKGRAAVVEKAPPAKLYDNYATLGVGSYTTFLGEVYLNHALNRNESVGGYFSHHSSAGGIDGVVFDNNFSDSKLSANYSSQLRDLAWNLEAAFQHQTYNWYGFPETQIALAQADNAQIDHAFYSGAFGADISFEDTYINSAKFKFRRFGDDLSSGENHFAASTLIDIPVNRQLVSTGIKFEYLKGSFKNDYANTGAEINYGNFIVSASPSFELKQDDLTVNLGASVAYISDIETGDGDIHIYPNISATYRLVNDVLIAYGSIKGSLIQNTYFDFASENPFVSPTLNILPTDQQYNAHVGLKGKLSSNMSYNLKGSYFADNNKALFKTNEITRSGASYTYGNSFGLVYDDMDTVVLGGEIDVDVNRNFTLSIQANYYTYNMSNQEEPWNLPDITGNLFLDYQIDEHWFAGMNLYYMGQRKDQIVYNDGFTTSPPETVLLDSYFDANAHVGYHINDKISVFAKGNNLANNGYQRWSNYPVQGLQLLAGATFKFDF
ncbi:TonB-dependent receptor [Gaetbulibacter aestuarii]|uniref:TonB-dependent receptor n=1 Tax=Gaetbulibacter aestuarii TaxID=1502358 RepID=A0ABW7MYI3_9FLAO